MICEKCGKINPGKNTVCSSCNAPLPVSKSCGGFEDILTINVPVPEAAPAQATISSVSSVRTEAAIKNLGAANEELKKKNSMLMIFSLGAAGLALIALIVAIIAAAVPGVSPEKVAELEYGLDSLESEFDTFEVVETYDAVENDLVYSHIYNLIISDEFKICINTATENKFPLPKDGEYPAFENLENYLSVPYSKLSEDKQAIIADSLDTAFKEYSSEDLENWLSDNFSTIYNVYTGSASYKESKILNKFAILDNAFTDAANEVMAFVPTADNKKDYEAVKGKYERARTDVTKYYTENKSDLEKNQYLKAPENKDADAQITILDYYYAGNFEITFNVPNSKPVKFTLANEGMFVKEKTDENVNVLPETEKEIVADGKTLVFVGWATTKMPASEDLCLTDNELTTKTAYDNFKDIDTSGKKSIELHPIFVEIRTYVVKYEGTAIEKNWPYYVLGEEDYPADPEADNPFVLTDGNKTFKGYKKVIVDEEGNASFENDKIYSSIDFIGKTISEVEGTYAHHFEEHKFIYFKGIDETIIASFDNCGDYSLTEDDITNIQKEIFKENHTYVISTEKDEKGVEIDFKKFIGTKLEEIVVLQEDGTESITWYVKDTSATDVIGGPINKGTT